MRVVLQFPSGKVERTKRDRPPRLASISWVIFMRARVSLALLSLRENEGLIVVKMKRLDQ